MPKRPARALASHDLAAVQRRLPTLNVPFTRLASLNGNGVFVGHFTGPTPWERHATGDELVQVLDGAVALSVLTPRGRVDLTLRAGSVLVVPRGRWHRQIARRSVTVLTVTPTPTDLSFAADPRIDAKPGTPSTTRSRRR